MFGIIYAILSGTAACELGQLALRRQYYRHRIDETDFNSGAGFQSESPFNGANISRGTKISAAKPENDCVVFRPDWQPGGQTGPLVPSIT